MKLFTYEYKLSSIKNERNARKMGALIQILIQIYLTYGGSK